MDGCCPSRLKATALSHRHWSSRAGNSCGMDLNPGQLVRQPTGRIVHTGQGGHKPCHPFGFQGKLSPWCVTYLTLVGFFSCVYQIVLLEVSQLGEALIAGLAFKWSLSTVYSEVHLGRKKAINNLQLPDPQ